jgi:protein TonB
MDEPISLVASTAVSTGIATAVRGTETAVTSLLPTTIDAKAAAAPPPPPPPKPKVITQTVGGDVMAARIIRSPSPVYPPMAKTARVQGTVVVEVEVDEEGFVINARATDGPPLLRQAAVDAVRQWVYSPVLLNGEPIAVTSTVRVNFNLQ